MTILDYSKLDQITDSFMNRSNAESFLAGLNKFGFDCGLHRPHRLAMYVAQMCHESYSFRYDEEIWGPTPAQQRYDTRTDLGNTPQRDGDGYRFRGRTGIQITGGDNYRLFTLWARKLDPKAPDFGANPAAVLTDPWEGLGPIWYWDTRGLNKLADKRRFKVAYKEVTRRINGGTNGYEDRVRYYRRAALVLLGYGPNEALKFQKDHGLTADGVCGPLTRQAMHEALIALPPIAHRQSGWAAVWSFLSNLFTKKGTL